MHAIRHTDEEGVGIETRDHLRAPVPDQAPCTGRGLVARRPERRIATCRCTGDRLPERRVVVRRPAAYHEAKLVEHARQKAPQRRLVRPQLRRGVTDSRVPVVAVELRNDDAAVN
jgi:hypothetical protein